MHALQSNSQPAKARERQLGAVFFLTTCPMACTITRPLAHHESSGPLQVHVGDYVKIDLDDRNTGVGQIIELFQDPTASV